MGNCTYCQKPAGWFRSKHPECETAFNSEQERIAKQHQAGLDEMAVRIHAALNGEESLTDLPTVVMGIKAKRELSDKETASQLLAGWQRAVDAFLDDGLLVKEEESRLAQFANGFKLEMNDLPDYDRLIKSAALTDLVNGRLPNRFHIPDGIPVNLQRGETIVWTCQNTAYLEDRTKRQYVGGSQGVSMRVMSGVYYRVGAFKGHSIERTERVHVDDGLLVVTDKNIYFAGPKKSLRIPYSKIVSFEPFTDGIGLHRDAATAKPQIFVTGDGWFCYNLVANLAKR